jgi:hypothetical protein
MTSQASQRHESSKMFAFLPVSATSQINTVQMLVSWSRSNWEVRLYRDSKAVLREAAIRPGQGASAVELIDGATGVSLFCPASRYSILPTIFLFLP